MKQKTSAVRKGGKADKEKPGKTGWLVPAGDVDQLAAAMTAMLDAPVEELDRMGRTGAERVARDHNVAIEARKLRELIG